MPGTVLLTVAATNAAVVAVGWFVRTQTSTDRYDLRSVSHQWVGMHRADSGNTVNR